MEFGSSAGSSIPPKHPSERGQQQRLPSPVPTLVEHLRRARGSQNKIIFPQSLLQPAAAYMNQIPPPTVLANEAADLVDALDDGTSDVCCRLDNIAYQTVYAFLNNSEQCLAHQRGHCLFVESLHPSQAPNPAKKASLLARKEALGKNVLARLIKAFLDPSRSNRSRRWIGSLALELLRDCNENKRLLTTTKLAPTRQALGEAIIHGNDEILRLIGGTIVREMIDNGASPSDFLPADIHSDSSLIFPDKPTHNSQWTTEFIDYVDGLETQGLLTQERYPLTFAYGVSVDQTSYNTETGDSILVTVADGLTVVVPSTGTDTAKYIDVPIEHINDIQLTEGGPGSQPRRKTQTKPAVLAFHVSGTPYSAYYINECGCAPCGINLAFDTLDDASFIREQIERRMAQHKDIEGRSAGGTTPTPDGKDARYPAIEFNQSSPHSSHSASLSISDSHRGQDVTTSHKPLEASQGMPSIDSMATALDAHNQKAISTHKQQKLDTETSQEGKVEVRRASPAPSTSMLAGKYPAYVRKKSSHGEIPSHGRSNSDDAFNIGPISSAIWREGLYTIETAKELNPKPPAAQPPVNTESGPQKNSGLGDKPNPMTLPRKALQSSPKTSLDPRRGNGKSNLLLGAPAEGSRARKLCHSMRVGENEREPAPFSTAGDKKLSAHKSKTSLTKQDVLSGPRSNTSKRKNVAVEAAVANKKRNVKDAATDKLEAANDDPYHVDAHAEGGEFDIPDTPPDQNTVGIAKKSKVSNVKAKTKAPKADSKAPNSATRTSKLGAFSAASTQKAARISALDESNHDHDMVDDQAETPNGVENNNCSELARKQPRKAQPAAPKPSQPTKKRQPAEPRSKNKTTKATDNAPVRPPRQRRAAAEKATRQMRYIGDNSDNKAQGQFMADGAEVEDKLQQGSAQKNESKRSSRNGKAVRKALESSTLEKDGDKARRLGESTAEQPNQNADFAAEQDATLGYSTSHSQQPPFQDQSPAQLPLGQLKQTTMKPVEVVDRASHQPQVISPQQRIATSNVKPLQPVALSAADAEGSAQDLADPKEANLYINMSEANPATSEVALENPKAPSVDKDDVHAEVEDTHFEDAIQTLLLEAEDPSVHGAYLHQQGDTSVHQEQNSDVHSLSAAEEDVILIDMTKEGPIKEKSDKIEGAAIAKMETGRSEMTIGLPGVRENRFQENNNTGPPVQNIAASNSANTDQSKVLYQELQNQPADSRTAEPDAQSSGIPVYTRPEPPPEISEALQNPRDPGRSRRSMTPALLLHEDGAASTVSGRKKRGFDGMDQQPRSRKKQKRTPQANRAMDRSVNNTTLLKDPRRLPQVIGFSAEGPRNQGLSSLAIGLGASEQEGQMNERTSKFGFVQKQKRARRTVFANTSEPSGPGSPLAHVHHKADDAPIMELDGNTALSIDAFSEQPVPTESGPRRQPKGPLLTHSSLFVGESAPRYSSQGSRVDEKGSPLPSRRIHGASHRLKDVQQASESEDAEYPLDDDETRIIRRAEEEALEPDLPPLAAPSLGRKKQVGFSGSSNSKYGPSSPNAPSAIVAEAQPHTIESDGRFVNVETAAVLEPSNLQDPFASRKLPPFNGFLDKLRRASQGRAQAGHEALRDTGSMKPPTKVAPTAGEDPDETLVEGRLNRPRKRRQTTPAATDTSATSSSEEQQSPPSDLSDAYGQRWRDALEPHQHNMLAVLYELSHNVIGHLVDTETAIKDIVKDYQQRGVRIIKHLADDLERELEDYIATAAARRDDVMKQNEDSHAEVTKNLQRQPKAEALAKQLETRQQVLDARMEETLGLCG